jgi:hypothetical protein
MQIFTNTPCTPKTHKQSMTTMMNIVSVIQSIETNDQRNKMVETQISILVGCFWVFIHDIQTSI